MLHATAVKTRGRIIENMEIRDLADQVVVFRDPAARARSDP
jgi:hypothetical protein